VGEITGNILENTGAEGLLGEKMRIRIVDENGKNLMPDILDVLDIEFMFDKPFEAYPSPYSTEISNEYEVKTDAKYCHITLRIGKIILFEYRGEPKDLTIRISNNKIDAIKALLG